MKQKSVVTHTARPTEIAASPDSWVTNKACVKMLCPKKDCFSLYRAFHNAIRNYKNLL